VGVHWRVARFEVSRDDPSFAPPESEVPLITQWHESAVHTGSDLNFGPDGYLYISVGDAEADYSTQRIDREFLSGILRIDVDKRRGSFPANSHPGMTENYRIPPDNPSLTRRVLTANRLISRVRTLNFRRGAAESLAFCFRFQTGELIATTSAPSFLKKSTSFSAAAITDGILRGHLTPHWPSGQELTQFHHWPNIGAIRHLRDRRFANATAIPYLDGRIFFRFLCRKNRLTVYSGRELTAPGASRWMQSASKVVAGRVNAPTGSQPIGLGTFLDKSASQSTRWAILIPTPFSAASRGAGKNRIFPSCHRRQPGREHLRHRSIHSADWNTAIRLET
jgi:hypothetical protein